MNLSRILLFVAGILIAAGAAYLVAQSFAGLGEAVAPTGAGTAEANRESSHREAGTARWEDFARPGDSAEQAPRPILEIEGSAPNPFDGPYARAQLAELALRLEGLAPGEHPMALISGRIVRMGDSIETFRVARIDGDGVSLVGPSGVRLELTPVMSAPPGRERLAATATPPSFLPTTPRAGRESTGRDQRILDQMRSGRVGPRLETTREGGRTFDPSILGPVIERPTEGLLRTPRPERPRDSRGSAPARPAPSRRPAGGS